MDRYRFDAATPREAHGVIVCETGMYPHVVCEVAERESDHALELVVAANLFPTLVDALRELVGIQSSASDHSNNLDHLYELVELLARCGG